MRDWLKNESGDWMGYLVVLIVAVLAGVGILTSIVASGRSAAQDGKNTIDTDLRVDKTPLN